MSNTSLKTAQYSAAAMALLTLITFGFAMVAVPPSGPYCPAECMDYPFLNLLHYYPRDYLWMYMGIPQLVSFVFFAVTMHVVNDQSPQSVSSFSGVAFALISATVLMLAYWMQFSVVPASAMNKETDGIALLTQYNGHGIFIAMEELGFVTMSISLFFFAVAFSGTGRLAKSIRLLLGAPLVLMTSAFIGYATEFGVNRSYRFEVAAITINWLALIVLGILCFIYFRTASRAESART